MLSTDLLDKIDIDEPILIAGPTASGKSGLALELADRFDGVIVNADALQVYDCWRVLSARPSREDEARVKHLLYGYVSYDTPYSVGSWLRDFADVLAQHSEKMPIIVGGTGLYFSALTEGLARIPDIPDTFRQHSNAVLAFRGVEGLLKELERRDPKTLARIDTQNPVRVQRAWEVLRHTGIGLADWQEKTPPAMLPLIKSNAFVLKADTNWLNTRIENRFNDMITDGCIEECRSIRSDWNPDLPASKAIGAAELMAHLNGEMSLEQATEAATLATRQYAKRQRSWFRGRMDSWTWVDLSTGSSG